MFRSAIRIVAASLVVSAVLPGCGGGGETERNAGEETPREETEASKGGSGIAPCELLSAAQVATVMSGADEGYVAADGGSLIDGVDSYQCSYSNPDTDLFTVILTIAESGERFEDIEPNPSLSRQMYPEAFREIQVGSGGWLAGEADDMKLTAVKGYAVIALELMAPDAGAKGDALVDLASAIAAKLP